MPPASARRQISDLMTTERRQKHDSSHNYSDHTGKSAMNLPFLQLRHQSTAVAASAEALVEARAAFDRNKYLKLPAFVEPSLLATLLDELDRTEFYDRVHEGIGTELCAVPGVVTGTLEMLMNDPVLHQTVEAVTGCGHIGCFQGRAYRLVPNTGHHDSWHSDVGEDRLIALSINLGREPYEGGRLQIRYADATDVLSEVSNPIAGDAVMFRVDPGLRHRVDPVTGRAPRTAYAGWFCSQPEFVTLMLERLGR